MKEFSVCYDRFCLGNYTLVCDVSDTVQATADLGAFEMYVLGMWNDGLVVTMKAYDEVCGENQFVLLVPDGSEQLMSFSPGRGFVVRPYRAARRAWAVPQGFSRPSGTEKPSGRSSRDWKA